jgi:hypothetical protein
MFTWPLFAQQHDGSLEALPWFAWVAITAIGFGGVTRLIQALFRHRERMAMIHMGMNPDRPGATDRACETKPWVPETSEL